MCCECALYRKSKSIHQRNYFCLYNYIVTFDYLLISGCYGDMLRVKILYNKKDSALIQFAESFLAQTGTCLYAMCVVCMYNAYIIILL